MFLCYSDARCIQIIRFKNPWAGLKCVNVFRHFVDLKKKKFLFFFSFFSLLIDVGVCALVGCTNYIILHNYF